MVTVTGANALIGETNLNFDGTNLSIGTTTSAKKILVYEGSSGESAMEFQNTGTGVGAGNGMYVGLDANENGKIYNQEANGMLDFGTANTSRLVVAENGSVGINETTPLGKLHVKKADSGGSVMSDNDALVLEGSAGIGMTLLGGTADEQTIAFGDSGDSDIGYIKYHHNTNYMAFGTNAGERMRILTGGEVIINRTSTFFGGNILQIVGKNDAEVVAIAVATNGKKAIQFANAGLSDVGNIVTSSSSVAYNTSSDYRLKENETPITDGITRLKTLKPYRFNWLADNDENGNPTQTVDGFFAHEVTAVPEAINGTKDAMHPEVLYADKVLYTAEDYLPEGMNIGDTKSPADELPEGKNFGDVKEVAKPNHQGIDQSKLVPLLVKSLQEALAEIDILKTKVTALENA